MKRLWREFSAPADFNLDCASSAEQWQRFFVGRSRYNRRRQLIAAHRRLIVVRRDLSKHGSKAELAEELGVSRPTISRDLAAIHADWLEMLRSVEKRSKAEHQWFEDML